MAAKRTPAQRAQLKTVQKASGRPTGLYALRMRPYLLDWEQRDFKQREIVAMLNEYGAPVPSEWKDSREAPVPVKQWSLTQYQRFRIKAEEVHMANTFSAKRDGRTNVKPKGDGMGLFARPELVDGVTENRGTAAAPVGEDATSSVPTNIESLEQSIAAYKASPKLTKRDQLEVDMQEAYLDILLDERDRLAAGGAPRVQAKFTMPSIEPLSMSEYWDDYHQAKKKAERRSR